MLSVVYFQAAYGEGTKPPFVTDGMCQGIHRYIHVHFAWYLMITNRIVYLMMTNHIVSKFQSCVQSFNQRLMIKRTRTNNMIQSFIPLWDLKRVFFSYQGDVWNPRTPQFATGSTPDLQGFPCLFGELLHKFTDFIARLGLPVDFSSTFNVFSSLPFQPPATFWPAGRSVWQFGPSSMTTAELLTPG